jgi:hypothetical protein
VDKSRRVRWAAHVERVEEIIERFGGEYEVKDPPGRSRRALEDDSKMVLKK